MFNPTFVCISLINSIFGVFSNIYYLSAQKCVKCRHKIRPIAINFRPIFFCVRRQIDGRRGRFHVAKFHVDTVSDEKVILEKPRGSDPTPQAVAG